MLRCVRWWALAGAGVPAILLVVAQLQGGVWRSPEAVIVLWPSALLLMMTDGFDFTFFALWIYGLSIVINVGIYAGVGLIMHRLRQRLGGGT